MTTSSPPFSLVVSLQFTAEEHKAKFIEIFTPLAVYVKENEPNTIAYELLLSDKDPLHAMILERYTDKDKAFLKVHKTSEPFLEFRPKFQQMLDAGFVKMEGQSYLDSGAGFGDRVA